jgi:hypothetical protein
MSDRPKRDAKPTAKGADYQAARAAAAAAAQSKASTKSEFDEMMAAFDKTHLGNAGRDLDGGRKRRKTKRRHGKKLRKTRSRK